MRTSILQNFPLAYAHIIQQNKKIKYKDRFLKASYLLDLAHQFIIKKFMFNKTEFNMWSVLLRHKYGTHYNYYVDWLIDHKIIKLKSKWQSGVKAKTYVLAMNLNNDKTIRIKNTDKVLLKKWNNKEQLKEMSDIYKLMISDLEKIVVDFDKAFESLRNEYDCGMLNDNKYFKNVLSLEQLRDGSIYAIKDKYGRLHTNFTTMKKSIRNNYLRLDGCEADCLDIKNSQPQFLAKIILETELEENLSEELQRFVQLVRAGKFYESFNDLDLPRSKIKEIVYRVFFGKNIMIKNNVESKNKANQLFIERWPEVWNWIVNWKRNSGDYKKLSHNLQERESDLVYNHICKEIKEKLPNTTIFTVHDSVFFPTDKREIIEEIFFRNMKKLI